MIIRLEHIHKSFGKIRLFEDLNLEVMEGKTTSILGPNGSGKTTLVKLVLGLVIPDRGKVIIDKEVVKKDVGYKRFIGYMPQVPKFPENLTIREIISMVEDIRGEKAVRIDELISCLNLEDELSKRFSTLSSGTKHKVGALLALAFDTPLLILDEPMVGLDPISVYKLKDLLKREKTSKTIIYISHIMSEVEEMADEVIFLKEGKMVFHGEIEALKEKTGKNTLEEAMLCLLS